MIKAAYLFDGLPDLFPGSLCLCTVSYSKDQAGFVTLGDPEIILHLFLVVDPKDAGGESKLQCLITHVHRCHADIALRKPLCIPIMLLNERHHLCRLLHEDDKGGDLLTERSARRTAIYYKCITEFFLGTRLINDDELPWLGIGPGDRRTPCSSPSFSASPEMSF